MEKNQTFGNLSNKEESVPGEKRNTPRDVFLHLLVIVTLYWSAITFVMLLWQIINYFLPEISYYFIGITERMRFAIASLIIVFPVFLLTSWCLNKIYRREVAVRESKIRKWLIYLTLFIAALVVIIDLVMVILELLAGGTTLRFILKALSVLAVAVTVFGYYLNDVKEDSPTKLAKLFALISGIIVLAAVICAFFVVGSPSSVRLTEFDQQKVSDLQNIQYQIVNYWQRKEKLPESLSVLDDPISGFKIPVDPQSGQAYEYIVKDAANLSFLLCANFNRESKAAFTSRQTRLGISPYDLNQNWAHTAGRVCFERTIDRELYPPLKKGED